MEGRRFIREIKLRDFLSYGDEGVALSLEPLNVLIGPNASGKSNLIEAVSLLQSAPGDLKSPMTEGGGGINEWLWKGDDGRAKSLCIEVVVDYPKGIMPLRYRLELGAREQRLHLVDEALENEEPTDESEQDVYFFYRYQNGNPVLNVRSVREETPGTGRGRERRGLEHEEISSDQSVLSQKKDFDQYPEITYVAQQFKAMRLYRNWNLGRYTKPRLPQSADLPGDYLMEDASNLGLVLNNLEHTPGFKAQLLERLREFYPLVEDVSTKIQGGTVQVYLHERGLGYPVPATRLSDGTLRYLCLITILCHPSPPPLVCIEEPELDLHPDILAEVADMLQQASDRTQVILTTHSDVLVSHLTDTPEAVVVCERDERGTQLSRLERAPLETWIDKYALGELWLMGEVGGTL